jgi:hypothetical protein
MRVRISIENVFVICIGMYVKLIQSPRWQAETIPLDHATRVGSNENGFYEHLLH